jgi:tripartite-type tricarboxylate transporter receptor subunit TctC
VSLLKRKVLLMTIVAAVFLPAAAVNGQDWPTKPVRMIVPFPPGGTMDVLAREIGRAISAPLGQSFVVENKPGASTIIGVDAAAKSTDDHTFVMVANSFTVNPTMRKNLPYDTRKDLQPVVLVARTANVLAVHPSVPANNLQEFIAYAKKNRGKISYGSFGNGTTAHFAGEMLKMRGGFEMVHIPYKGQIPGLNDLIAGRLQAMFGNLPEFLPQIQAGKIRPIGTTYLERSKYAPDIPTIAEQGFPGFTTDSWYGILAPASMSAAAVKRMNAEINKALASKAVADGLELRRLDRLGGSAEQFGKFIGAEIAKYAKVVRDANITVD